MAQRTLPLRVLKFGGTSVGDPPRIAGVVDIVRETLPEARVVVVVSAMSGVTGALTEAAGLAAAADPAYAALLGQVVERHTEAARELASGEDVADVLGAVEAWSRDLGELLHGASLVRECTQRTLDSILARGELTSATLVAAALRRAGVDAAACDARALVVTDARFGGAVAEWETSRERVRRHFAGNGPLQVVTGFIGATGAGETTTLGRGGSDFTASLFGAILVADRVEIWTDVDGVMSADPRLVPDAFSIPSLSYDELLELSHFGAKVVHAPSVRPVREHGVPLLIRNTLRPEFPGTRISTEVPPGGPPVRGISSIPNVALLRLEGDGMVGVPGIAERLFRALARGDVSVILISQASSEHSICFAVGTDRLDVARREVEEEFRLERRTGLVNDLVVEADCAIIAAVGAGMRETPGVAGRLFSILGRHGINIRAIAQGSSELNVSFVVAGADAGEALRALHEAVVAP
jgi:aspartokinase/homoserine dehydrogenase 1